jgi:hypothetical protein
MRKNILWSVLAILCLTLTAGPAGAGGIQKWAFAAGWTVNSPALGRDGTIYASSRDGKLYAVTPGGFQKWAFDTVNQLESSPAVGADGTIYVASWDGKLYAVYPGGTERWTFFMDGAVSSSPAVGAGGTIYVGGIYPSNLYAIYGDSSGLARSAWPMFHHDLRHTGNSSTPYIVFSNITGILTLLLGD